MKLKIAYIFKGKPYPTLEDEIHEAIIDSIKENIEENLKPFSDEINKSGGTININIDDNYNWQMQFKNMPVELIDKINAALNLNPERN
jgi:hypothetical protein